MPTYEYRCRKNNHTFEVFQSIHDKPLERCQQCDSPVDKLVSAAAFHLKGSGWYTTDYKSSSGGSATKKNKESSEPKAEKSNGAEGAVKKTEEKGGSVP